MRPILILSVASVLVGACASHPADTTTRKVEVDASNIVEVQKAGYIIKDENGKRLYCVKEQKTGSHIQTTTICLTEQEWDQLHDNTQRAMHAISKQIPPAQGH